MHTSLFLYFIVNSLLEQESQTSKTTGNTMSIWSINWKFYSNESKKYWNKVENTHLTTFFNHIYPILYK